MEDRAANWRKIIAAHADHMLVDSITEKWGIRFFVAHLSKEEIVEDRWPNDHYAKMRHMVFVDQLWVVTFH